MTLAPDRTSSPNLPNATVAERALVVWGRVDVFAKAILEDAAFARLAIGAVQGYAANTVQSQRPKPGTPVRLAPAGA